MKITTFDDNPRERLRLSEIMDSYKQETKAGFTCKVRDTYMKHLFLKKGVR